jgi:Domain of unknown function (DUF1772)
VKAIMGLELVALLFTTAFASICVYVAIVEHPARLATDTAAALAQWRPSYRRAAALQIVLAIGGVLSAIGAFVAGQGYPVLIAGLVLALVTPFTLIVIMPTNKQLLDPRRHGSTPGTQALLKTWGSLHLVRTAIGLVALAILVAHFATKAS